jgi:CheY-like chemotaxis protein
MTIKHNGERKITTAFEHKKEIPNSWEPLNSAVKKRILCVDDEMIGLIIRGQIFEDEGYSVVVKMCPFEALRCNLSEFDLAVVDFEMPGMNGCELLLRMRALGARFPIILLSGSASSLSDEDRVLFSRCIDKADSIRSLLDTIGKFLDPNELPDFGS